MSKTIIEEVHEWAKTQIQTNPISKQLVAGIIERGNKEILERYIALKKQYVDLEMDAGILADMVLDEVSQEDLAIKNVNRSTF